MGRRVASPAADAPVTSLELFFDLVFVFTITQLTAFVFASSGAESYLRAALLLFVVFWMYDGYCYLANNVGPTTASTKVPMLVAMAAFLVLAAALPGAFGPDRWLFAAAYLVVVLVHVVSFTRSSLGGSARAILAIAPVNIGCALLLFVAAAVPEPWRTLLWCAGIGFYVAAMLTRRESGFTIRPGHFAERHRLLLIIALGESVIAIGVSARGGLHHAFVLVAVLLSLVLISALWWLHFDDEERTERALEEVERTDPARTARVALLAFSMGYLVLVAGLVLVAAGLHDVVHAPGHHLGWGSAGNLAVGTGLFLEGHSFFLWRLGVSSGWALKTGAVLCLPTALLGHATGGAVQAASLVVVVLLAALLRQRDDGAVSERGPRSATA